MGKVFLTLLVPRTKKRGVKHPYAVQMTYPWGDKTHVSVRLFDKTGKQADRRTSGSYRPGEWRAATRGEQDKYCRLSGNPQPWFPFDFRDATDVFDNPDSGDRETNNGQAWDAIDEGSLFARWGEERKKRVQFNEEDRKRAKDDEEWEEAEMERRSAEWGEE